MEMVDLTNLFSWTILMHLARHLIMFNIVHAMLKSKYNTAITFIGIVGIGLLYSYVSLHNLGESFTDIFLYALFIFLEIVIVHFTCIGSLFSKIFSVLLGVVCILLSNMIITPILVFMGVPSEYFISNQTPLIVVLTFTVCGYSLSFLGAFIIKSIKNRALKKNAKHTTKAYIFLLIPIIHIFSFLIFSCAMQVLNSVEIDNAVLSRLTNYSVIISFISFALDTLIIFLVDFIDKLEYKNVENEKQILSNTLTYQQTVLLNEEKKEFRKMKHDINNLLTTVVGFIELGKTEKALEILKETGISFYTLGGTSICSNDLLNTIFYIKDQCAKKEDVDFSVSVVENSTVKINDYDLCRVLNNLIDNSINAASQAKSIKKSKIDITIEDSCILMVTHNTFDSVKQKNVRDINHGHGIQIINDIIKKYNGNYTSKVEKEIYITETVIDNNLLKSEQ